MTARKIVKPPGPYQSVLNAHLVEIAGLRETRPQPTPYRAIAKILKEKYGLQVSPNSIWSFVRARTLGRGRKLKYKIAPDLVQPPATLAPVPGPLESAIGGAEQETDQKLTAIETARARAKARTQKQETKKWDLGYDPSKPLKDQT
ncbi:MAG: hypothetical protein WB586_09455 [Chthoniobacterales bacterium]